MSRRKCLFRNNYENKKKEKSPHGPHPREFITSLGGRYQDLKVTACNTKRELLPRVPRESRTRLFGQT